MEELLFTNDCEIKTDCDIYYDIYNCSEHNWSFCVFNDITTLSNYELKNKIYNLIFEWIVNHGRYCKIGRTNYKWHFYYDKNESVDKIKEKYDINIANLMKSYPSSFIEKANRALINLSKLYPTYGDEIFLLPLYNNYRAMMLDNGDLSSSKGMAKALVDLGYFKLSENYGFIITA